MASKDRQLPALSPPELRRYARHLSLPDVGEGGQRRLKAGRVLLVGAGGLGSPAALYLAAAGVGTLGFVDWDAVEESNLQRQIAHGTASLGVPKVESLRARLADLNPHVVLEPHDLRLDRDNALELFARYDVIVDGSDNFQTRYLANDACVLSGRPYVYGSILRFEGQASVFAVPGGPCYRCLFPQPPPPGVVPGCAEAGVLGVLPGVIGAIQATEALKLLLGASGTLAGRLLLYDAWAMTFRELSIARDPACPLCGDAPTIRELQDYDELCGMPHAADEPQAPEPGELAPLALRELRERGEDLVLLDVREGFELSLARLGGELHVPLALLPIRLEQLDPTRTTVVLCHHGSRSALAAHFLREHGFGRVLNLTGGIDAYAREADPTIPRY